jgi:hypothetical protein
MAREIVKLEQGSSKDSKDYSLEKIRKSLSEHNACYVLITCKAPTQDGKMDVEMSYEGDEVLASYLVDNAQQVFDDRAKSEKSH